MIFAACIGILTAIVVLIAMWRIDIKKFMGYPATMDVTVTVLLAAFLHGSVVGLVAAVIGGLFFSLVITVIRRIYGYKRLERRGLRLVWVEYEGVWYAETKQRINAGINNFTGEEKCSNLKLSKVLTISIVALFVLASVL